MNGKYNSLNLGQAIQTIPALTRPNSTLSIMQMHWNNIVPEFMHNMCASKYIEHTKVLFVTTHVPVMYIKQYADQVRNLLNSFFGAEMVLSIRFIHRR